MKSIYCNKIEYMVVYICTSPAKTGLLFLKI